MIGLHGVAHATGRAHDQAPTTCVMVMFSNRLNGFSWVMGSGLMSGLKPLGSIEFLKGMLAGALPKGLLLGALPKGFSVAAEMFFTGAAGVAAINNELIFMRLLSNISMVLTCEGAQYLL